MQIDERFFRQVKQKTQAILYVLTSIFVIDDGKRLVKMCASELIRGYMKGAIHMRQRNNSVTVRFNDEELMFLQEMREKTGLPFHSLIVKALGSAQLPSKEYTEKVDELLRVSGQINNRIKRNGDNINQLARVANRTNNAPALTELIFLTEEQKAIKKECEDLWQYIKSSIPKD